MTDLYSIAGYYPKYENQMVQLVSHLCLRCHVELIFCTYAAVGGSIILPR
jgi:hypothetical protein